jgi:hypothetical protein
MTVTTTARNASIEEIRTILNEQHLAKVDHVAPANALRYSGGRLVIPGAGPEHLEGEGADMRFVASDATLDVTDNFERQLLGSDRLAIPAVYARRMRDGDHLDLLDENVNHWLARDSRSFMVRTFRDEDGTGGTARACLSNGYGIFDHSDFLAGVMQAVRRTGVQYRFRAINLTERNITIDVIFPEVTYAARELLRGYVSPFSGVKGEDLPIMRAGIRCTNSETGHGRHRSEPWAEAEVCTNGMTLTKFAPDFSISHVHRGRRLDDGTITWSDETRQARIAALTAEVADLVTHFSQPDTFAATMEKVTQASGKPVAASESREVITRVAKGLAFTEAERDEIFRAFDEGQQLTAGGVVQAITAAAQRVTNPDRSTEMEGRALEALALV